MMRGGGSFASPVNMCCQRVFVFFVVIFDADEVSGDEIFSPWLSVVAGE